MAKKRIAVFQKSGIYAKIALVENRGSGKIVTRLIKKEIASSAGIADIFKQENISYDSLIVVMPRYQVIVRNIELPATDYSEINDIINIQIGKLTPFSKDEIIFNFNTVGINSSNYSKILLTIVQKAVIKSYIDSFSGKNEAIDKIVLSSECHGILSRALKKNIKEQDFAIIDFDSDFSDFCVFSKSRLMFTKILHFGLNDMTRADWRERFDEEIKICLSEYDKQNFGIEFNKIAPINLNGTEYDDIKKILAKSFRLEAVALPSYTEGMAFSKEAKAVLQNMHDNGSSFLTLLDPVYNPEVSAMNFLPRDIMAVRQKHSQKKELALTAGMAAAILSVGMAFFAGKIYMKIKILDKLKSDIAEATGMSKALQEEYSKIGLIKKRLDAKNSVIEILSEVNKDVPEGIYLSTFVYSEADAVSLRGTSKDASEIFNLIKILKNTGLFKDVKVKYITERKELTDFEIICPLMAS